MTVVTESIEPPPETDVPQASPIESQAEPNEAAPHQDRLVPVNEAIRYRKRAQSAEQQLAGLQSQLDQAQQRCEQAEQTIGSLERRQRIDSLLAEADAIDIDAARLLTEAAVQSMDEPDVTEAVEDLRRHKPFLFHPDSSSADGLALAPQIEGLDDPLAQAAEQAQHSGDRRDLLRYLRLRRRP